ncbi:hypothetical protein EPUS_03339 [Endocarpon pusillum Z07020]|uniref:NACHT-NTPase and P-loop NTPases N-terminal domain-containing protein n=1 Tax=Endocarpon pusillum (strain Z07020 / HMAS-L-300199) TaxID=1263415 RepID=U1HPS0_ENDPU|nr:uncharacterized protein EPUS_03339 [Endocarpon pusillum Z07020]ERF71059.1 hypothetical protein EPUS_03339 [Endocarpon pusillum Z07020]
MEALAAASLAGNIVQLIDFVAEVFSKSGQIYHSATCASKEGEEQDIIIHELLVTLESFKAKKPCTRTQSLRKSFKSVWGKEKVLRPEGRLQTFRQELSFHILVDLRGQLDLSGDQAKNYFESLEKSAKISLKDLANIKQQVQETQSIQKQTQNIVTQEIDALAFNLDQQNEGIRALTADEGHQSQAQILDAVADAATMHVNAFSSESGKIKATIRDETANSRAHIAGLMETNQEVVKQQINDLQRRLQQLQIEIDRKEFLQSLLQQANVAVETVTVATKSNALQLRSLFKIVLAMRRNDNLSLAMYYAWYYEPLFTSYRYRIFQSGVSAKFSIEKGVKSLTRTPDESTPSSELRAVYDLARRGDQLLWTLTAMTAALNAYLDPEAVALVVQTVFNIRANPACILHRTNISYVADLVTKFFTRDEPAPPQLQNAQYDCKSVVGQRLVEDLALWSRLAHVSGLQQELSAQLAPNAPNATGSIQWPTTRCLEADLACTLLALFQQPCPWSVKVLKDITFKIDLPENGVLLRKSHPWVLASATHLIAFLDTMRSAGVDIRIEEVAPDEESFPGYVAAHNQPYHTLHMEQLRSASWLWPQFKDLQGFRFDRVPQERIESSSG